MKEVLAKCYCKNKCAVLKLYDYISIYDVRIKIINRGNAIYAINYLINDKKSPFEVFMVVSHARAI